MNITILEFQDLILSLQIQVENKLGILQIAYAKQINRLFSIGKFL